MEKIPLPDFGHNPIDIHSHINHGAPVENPESEVYRPDRAFIESVYRSYGVSQVGLSTFASVLDAQSVLEENRYLHQYVTEKEWAYQWVVIDPRQEETYTQARQLLAHPKVLGIKIHPDYHGYQITEHGDALFSFANAHHAVVLMHPQHLPLMPAMADRYPDMKLIIAHLASKEHVDAIRDARHGNIYTDTSGSASVRNNVVEYAVEQVGSEKILFGTDTYSFPFQFGRIALSGLSAKDKENILWKNALRLFEKNFRPTPEKESVSTVL